MRKFLALLVLIAAGTAWYVFSWIPSRYQADLDAFIAALKPRQELTYGSFELDVLGKRARLKDVELKNPEAKSSLLAKTLTVSPADDGKKVDAEATMLEFRTPDATMTARVAVFRNLSLAHREGVPFPTEHAEIVKAIGFGSVQMRDLTSDALKIASIDATGLEGGLLKTISFRDISLGTDQDTFRLGTASAEAINIPQFFSLPALSEPEKLTAALAGLHVGPIATKDFAAKIKKNEASIALASVEFDGLDKGRVARLAVSGFNVSGKKDGGPAFAVELDHFAIDDFPFVLTQPDSFDYEGIVAWKKKFGIDRIGGVDLKRFRVKTDDGQFGIDKIAVPKPVYRKSPGGVFYAAKSSVEVDLGLDTALLAKMAKRIPPAVLASWNHERINMRIAGASSMDAESGTGSIDHMSIGIDHLAELRLRGSYAGLPVAAFEAPEMPGMLESALKTFEIRNAELTLVNASLVQRLIGAFAAQQGLTVPAATQALARAAVINMTRDRDPVMVPMAREIVAFLRDPKSLTLSIAPRAGFPIVALQDPRLAQRPGAVGKILNLSAKANAPANP